MIDLDRFLADLGIVDGIDPAAGYVRGDHCQSAEKARQDLHTALTAMASWTAMLVNAVEMNSADDVFDRLDRLLGKSMKEAGLALADFRERRECVGEA